MEINKKLLSLKGHFFLFNAGTASLVPYLSTYARQLGFSSEAVGLIYGFMYFFGWIGHQSLGVIADRFRKQMPIFIFSLLVTIVSFSAIYFIFQNKSTVTVNLDCNQQLSVLRSRYKTAESIDLSKIDFLRSQKRSANCKMNCDMSPKMWQTVCERWHIPKYCNSDTKSINYVAQISNVIMRNKFIYISTSKATLDDSTYDTHCRIGDGYVEVNEPCKLYCTNQKLFEALKDNKVKMTCLDNNLCFRLIPNSPYPFQELTNSLQLGQCWASCTVDEPWRLLEICAGWGADAAQSCQLKTTKTTSQETVENFSSKFSFAAEIELASIIIEHDDVSIRMLQIKLPDGSSHYPNCISKAQYQMESTLFHTACEITCDNDVIE